MENSFSAKKIENLSLGEKLKHLREKNKMKLDDLAVLTKIQKRYLEYLERGEYSKLPPGVYIAGFIMRYAEIFKAEPKSLISQYHLEAGLEQESLLAKTTGSFEKARVIITPKSLFWSGAGLFIFVVGFYFIYQLSFFIVNPFLSVNNPPEQDLITKNNSLSVEGKTDPGADLFINNQKIYPDERGNFKANLNLKEGLNIIEVRADNVLGKSSQIVRRVIKE